MQAQRIAPGIFAVAAQRCALCRTRPTVGKALVGAALSGAGFEPCGSGSFRHPAEHYSIRSHSHSQTWSPVSRLRDVHP